MELVDIFPNGTQVCFVSPFRLGVPFISENDRDNESQYIYDKWESDISSKLTEKINSSGTDYMFSWNEMSGDRSDEKFAPNCFLTGEAMDCYVKNKYYRELGRHLSFSGIVFTIRSVGIKIWEFGFGSIKNNCLDSILAEFRQISRMYTTKFNIFEKIANNSLSYSDLCIFENSIKYLGLEKIKNSNRMLYSHINSYYAEIDDHIEKISLIFGKTIIVGLNFIFASIGYIIGIAALNYTLNPAVDEFEIIATNLLAQWAFLGLVFLGFILLFLSIFLARRDEKKHINHIRKKELKNHQMWIFMLKAKKKARKDYLTEHKRTSYNYDTKFVTNVNPLQ